MTFEQIKYFVEVCKNKSVSKTADNLYVSHQAISKAIKRIEAEYNIELFYRNKNSMELTKAGRLLYNHAQNIINELAAFDENVKKYQPQNDTLPTCNIAFAEPLLLMNGDVILKALSSSFPHTYFYLSPFLSEDLFTELPVADIYIALADMRQYEVMRDNPLLSDYKSDTFCSFPIYACISEHSPLKNFSILTLNDLQHYSYCNMRNTYSGRSYISFLKHYYPAYNKQNDVEIYTKKNFIDQIEKANYYTLDLKLLHNKFFYQDIFRNQNVIYKKTDIIWHIFIFYRKDCCNFAQIIKNELNKITSP